MSQIFLYNTLSREKEEFYTIKPGEVGLYACGPTVYNRAHIGNLRTYLFEDFLKRVLLYNDYKIKHVMNITDVGHLVGDRDMGEDKMEEGAAREGKTAWEIAGEYTELFKKDIATLNILEPELWCKATDHIDEQIALIKKLEKKGYTYKTSDGIYFNTSKIKEYNKLSHLPLDDLKEGARVEKHEEKKNPTDFALWKLSPEGSKRQMEWKSPWGVGFPGWHIECSAMSLKHLGDQLDIHCGGIDHVNIHHTNEIAQSEAATDKKFFNFWMHGAFLNISGGKKMSKSEDNFLSMENALINKGVNPLAYRFAALQVHYRKPMEYNEEGFKQAQDGLNSLYNQVILLGDEVGKISLKYKKEFLDVINDDFNMPQALAMLSSVLKSDLEEEDKLATILDFDKVLGLSLDKASEMARRELDLENLSKEVQDLVKKRAKARDNKEWEESDTLRKELEDMGYTVEDTEDGIKIYS